MTAFRHWRLQNSPRCGDCLFLTLGFAFFCLFLWTLFLRGPENSTYYQTNNNIAAGHEQQQQQQPAQEQPFESIWPAGKLKQGVDVKKQRRNKSPAKKAVDKIQAAIERLGMDPIPDTRHQDCRKFDEQVMTDNKYANAKIAIVIIPSEPTFSLPKFKTTFVSLLATTAIGYQNLEIGIVTASSETAKHLRESFDGLSSHKNNVPNFRILEREDFFEKQTLFKELLAIATTDFAESDVIVFITSGIQCNFHWLSALVDPLLESSRGGPVVVAPRYRNNNNEDRLLFNWRLAPKFAPIPTNMAQKRASDADVVPSVVFLPQAFAIKRNSDHFGRFLSFLSQRNIGDPTVFDAAMYFSRCLGSEIVTAPCSKLSMPKGAVETEFDPYMKTPHETKIRLAATWLSNYRAKLEPVLGKWLPSLEGPAHCKDLSSIITTNEESQLFTVPEEFKARDEYFYLASLAGTTFFPTNGQMRAGVCPFPENLEMMFKHTLGGAIQSPSGMCVTAPKEGRGYVEVSDCNQQDERQQWAYLQSGKLQSVLHRLCILHATDPHAAVDDGTADPTTQVLMLGDCTGSDESNFFKFTFAKNC